jgi:hypothetical protein
MEVRVQAMRNAYSYAGILDAVGRVLDEAGVKRFAIEDTGDGLWVEGFDGAGNAQVKLRYDVAALYDLIEQETGALRIPAGDEGTLRQFLKTHELVGAR